MYRVLLSHLQLSVLPTVVLVIARLCNRYLLHILVLVNVVILTVSFIVGVSSNAKHYLAESKPSSRF